MQGAAPVFLDVVCDQPRHHPATRTQPARQMRHADADLRRLQRIAQGAESLLENIEQGLPVNPVMRKHRFTPQQIAPIRILVITAQHLGVIRHHPGRVSRIQHAGGRRPGGNTGNHPRAQLELRRHHLPKTRLPPTAVAAARKDHLIKHARIPYSITHKPLLHAPPLRLAPCHSPGPQNSAAPARSLIEDISYGPADASPSRERKPAGRGLAGDCNQTGANRLCAVIISLLLGR